MKTATTNFDPANTLGKGAFGSVYKGRRYNGTVVAIKVLSTESQQGVREFLNEIVAISGVEHENLVELYGCCTEGDHRMLVYNYLENNSLARILQSGRNNGFRFSWKIRKRICVGVAEGLAFLHHKIQPRIVHRDIKASNILLDKDFNPKISDFGLAKTFPSTATHISTRVAATIGYLGPEYAMQGRLTRKADVYSFGVVLLEIVSGRSNSDNRLPAGERILLQKAWCLYEKGEVVELVDAALEGELNPEEACRYIKIGLLCTQETVQKRPTMSVVLKMLKGKIGVDEENISKPGLLKEFMALDISSGSQTQDKSSSCATMSTSSIYNRSA